MTSAWWIRLGGTLPATEIASHTQPIYETGANDGCLSANFALNVSPRSQHQMLEEGTKVEVVCGPTPMWTGEIDEYDRNTGEVQCRGLAATLRPRLALDGGGNVTRDVGVAITRNINNGWKGANPNNVGVGVTVPGAPGATGSDPVTMGTLLDDLSEWYSSGGVNGLRWRVNRLGQLETSPPGISEPRWMVRPDAAAFGTTKASTPTYLAGRYFDGTNYQTAYAGTPGPDEEPVNLDEWGTLTLTQAQDILKGKLQRRGFTGWINGVTLGREQFRTLGDSPGFLGAVRGGQTMRAHGLPYSVTSSLFLDVEIGKTRYVAGDDVIYVEPINTAPRDFVSVTAAA